MEKVIFRGKVGSHAFGTNTPESDVDIAEIYMCDNEDLLGLTYKEHDDIDKDNRRYELNKFIKLLMKGNPNMLEILYLPEDCVQYTTDKWWDIKQVREKFITKNLYDTFAGYARSQLNKATGLNKKINWELQKIDKKSVYDFCYVYINDNFRNRNLTKAMELPLWLSSNNYLQEQCGLVKLDHFRDTYLLYIDELEWVKKNDNPRYGDIATHNYQGIARVDADDVCVSSVPDYVNPKGVLYFNKDGYSMHCKDYHSYQTWLKNRNENRYNTNKNHGQKYDSKNIMHLTRLLMTARDIATSGIIKVRRSPEEIKHLLEIKSGKLDLKTMIDAANMEVAVLKILFDQSTLPDIVDETFCHELILKLRKQII